MEKGLTKVSANIDMERTKSEATQKEYLDKMATHTARAKHSLGLDKMLGEKKVELDGRDQDLELCKATLKEAQTLELNPRDNRDELMEFVELRRLLQHAVADRVIEVGWLATLVRDVSKVLANLSMPLSWRSPRTRAQPVTSWRQWMSSLSTCRRPTPLAMTLGIRRCSLIIIAPAVCSAPTLSFSFVLLS
jgi:dynactin complex subunit